MNYTNLDKEWTFRRGLLDSVGGLDVPGTVVNLPHDGMIGTEVRPDAPSLFDMGYFAGDLSNYTKFVEIPAEWKDDCVGLFIDGAMMNASIDVNGYRVCLQHYGYAPFYVDLKDRVTFGEANRISINVNTSASQISRWYTGSGLYRGVQLVHGPKVHIANNGIYVLTKEVTDGYAFVCAEVEIENATPENRLVEVTLEMVEEKSGEVRKTVTRVIQVNGGKAETARMDFALENPVLWDIDSPALYCVKAKAKNLGVYRTHLIKENGADNMMPADEASVLFGIRTITADAVRGLRINGKTVKLKGGCMHHDNGLLGAVSLYEAEARRIRKLKEEGFNAIRTSHNPPSSVFIEACDRLGMYVFDEAFDAWGIAKRASDYSLYFESDWEKDMTAFMKRDRSHPCVILWSTGNEIPERGGLNNGYTLATKLAEKARSLDSSRPVSNGICSLWSGLDDKLAKSQYSAQNALDDPNSTKWEMVTEPFTNGLDIAGYNYMEDNYEPDHKLFPDRVMLGSENFPRDIGYHWPLVERLPYVLGEFTWTAWDYLGEAGIGKTLYVEKDDPLASKMPWEIMPPQTTTFPWRTACDADFDITGRMLPQGAYRSVVWGSTKCYLFSKHPETHDKVEKGSMWSFPYVYKNWSYAGFEGKPVELVVYSNADEVEVLVNGKSLGKKKVCMERPWPNTATFETVYEPGTVTAISFKDGREVSRDELVTVGKPAKLRLTPEKTEMRADGHDAVFVNIEVCDEEGRLVPDAEIQLKAAVEGKAILAGFGSGNPITDENYTDDTAKTYHGHALAILRSGYEGGIVTLSVEAEGLCGKKSCSLKVLSC